ncbi:MULTISPECIES: ABC transporter substrate-binding protein [Pseudomonas]|jgi:ribose transport system substrate-binding protein|uniref:Ribose transport system substrate-binding protein n=1 Tax=Pseudomonas poae TaxID=200451 RepID=A0A7Z1K5V6_9PSED|nr:MULTISPECIES: ABC transporter substrate-binding protein [Pseudomonas]KAA8553725.1 D-threitol-binding protein [Pseudomonas marginalis]MCP1463140.1 ribose transport system substrate-binding protein [Pseudomonas sp. S3E17]PFG71739.1 ribose transport system substrate-binding protein [Pseudomonas poae]TWR73230.1 substrate-binding domain-containing protein [Pseudomonas marginalis]SCX30576.1 ribose transport system substrate-binding protein [Pseudomonas sp. NFACC25]
MNLKRMFPVIALAALMSQAAEARELKALGISMGSLGNPYFVTLADGATARAKELNPNVKVTSVSADYDLSKQFSQIDNFISSKVDLILINAVDPSAMASAIKKARDAGIVVVAVDVDAKGVNATVQTDNVEAGKLACQYLVDKLAGKGNVIIQNGPQVTAVTDRVKGCKAALAGAPEIKVLSDDQDGKGSREGGLNVMQGYLTRFPKIDGLFAINDPQAIGSDLAAKQLKRSGIIITSVDGAPDIENALKTDTQIQASASQDPWAMAQTAVNVGNDLLNDKAPAEAVTLLTPKLITRDNVGTYSGWSSKH